jgi:hypothetical protein
MSLKTLAVLGDRWQTDQADLLQFAAENPVPRKGAWLLQLRRDLRSAFMWGLIAATAAGFALGIAARHVVLIGYAGLILVVVGFMFLAVSKSHSTSTLVRGVIRDPGCVRRHPLLLGHVGMATVDELSQVVNVGLTSSRAVRLLREQGRMEVLILHDPKAEYSTVVGWRAA